MSVVTVTRYITVGWMIFVICFFTACTEQQRGVNVDTKGDKQQGKEKRAIKLVLDWTPNTNHTGLYVAQTQGYYEQEGLQVELIQPGVSGADLMVAFGQAHFAIGGEETLMMARVQNIPLVSIAAIIQHNTSGFAAPVAKNITAPKDFEGKIYGCWGSPIEKMVIETIMKKNGGDYKKVNIVNIGQADYFTAIKKDIDFSWIFYGWTGIEAELRQQKLTMLYINQYSDKLDYHSPILLTNEKLIKEEPALIQAFMRATTKGYQFAINKPEAAAHILCQAVPDLNKDLVLASQKWLSPKYQDDAPRWGEQKEKVWQNYMEWLAENKLISKKINIKEAYTNDFLSEQLVK